MKSLIAQRGQLLQRRSFLNYVTASVGLSGFAVGSYYLLQSMQPSSDVVAGIDEKHPTLPATSFAPGQIEFYKFLGRPVLIWRRSPEQIEKALTQDDYDAWRDKLARVPQLPDHMPAYDRVRTRKHEWLALWPICTRNGCIVKPELGDHEGFFCSCDSAHYDLAGRIRKGPAPQNMQVIPIQYSKNKKTFQLDLENPPKFNS